MPASLNRGAGGGGREDQHRANNFFLNELGFFYFRRNGPTRILSGDGQREGEIIDFFYLPPPTQLKALGSVFHLEYLSSFIYLFFIQLIFTYTVGLLAITGFCSRGSTEL